ncbi:glycosyl hydrolase [Paraphoma chrysanthemicola]|nr:glycosyl hydrolase [Paraphoma chrysanthemicola]
MKLFCSLLSFAAGALAQYATNNATFTNPALPGWNSDPSCVRIDDTFFCVTSTFIAFPGLPIYASKDLRNWKLISHAWNRESQLPGVSWSTTEQQMGMYAATIREHEGEIYVVCEYLGIPGGIKGVLFKTTDPFDDKAWSDPVIFSPSKIDPDLFWDDDGTLYVATQGIVLQTLDPKTGELSQPPIPLWNGTGGVWPEGPHIYKRDGYYYLLIAEGGTGTNHAVTIARAKNITGPYEAYEGNPILTNRKTKEYFQTVGHADLFQDAAGSWWGMALATRSGPEYKVYPMGRESVLFPVTWEEGEWPVLQPVRGNMSGWPSMPAMSLDVPGSGKWHSHPDVYDFKANSSVPNNLVHWRVPAEGAFQITEEGLEVRPSRNNLTGIPFGDVELSGQRGLSFIGRRQTDTLFKYSVDLVSTPQSADQEAGVTIFLTQVNHIDLGVVYLQESNATNSKGRLHIRFRVESQNVGVAVPQEQLVPVPAEWEASPIRLEISTPNNVTYELSAMSAENPQESLKIGTASAALVSGGNGTFVGSLIGAYATCNGAGEGVQCPGGEAAVFKRWRYEGLGQQIAADVIV